jgi:pilus assembly protein CpaB
MNKTIIFTILGAFVLAIAVALIVRSQLQPNLQNQAPQAQQTPMVEILVADQSIRAGSKLSPENTRWQTWPKDNLLENSIQKSGAEAKEEIFGRRARRGIQQNEPIQPSALVNKDGGNFMAAQLNDKMRAVSVEIEASTAAAGFIGPGDRVDVILTYDIRSRGEGNTEDIVVRTASETILHDVHVLAIDQETQELNDDAKIGKTATLEVTPNQAEIIALAREMGEITLSLRQLGDDSHPPLNKKPPSAISTTDVTVGETLRAVIDRRRAGDPDRSSIRIYNGSSITEIPVRNSQGAGQ